MTFFRSLLILVGLLELDTEQTGQKARFKVLCHLDRNAARTDQIMGDHASPAAPAAIAKAPEILEVLNCSASTIFSPIDQRARKICRGDIFRGVQNT
jgi:hypothetical protein